MIFYSASAIVCVFFTVAHHHNHESLARRAAIIGLVKAFTIDLLDTADILDVLFDTAKENPVSTIKGLYSRMHIHVCTYYLHTTARL